MRKERIIKRDEARFHIEKKKRAEERVERMAIENAEKARKEKLAKKEAAKK